MLSSHQLIIINSVVDSVTAGAAPSVGERVSDDGHMLTCDSLKMCGVLGEEAVSGDVLQILDWMQSPVSRCMVWYGMVWSSSVGSGLDIYSCDISICLLNIYADDQCLNLHRMGDDATSILTAHLVTH